MSLVNSEAVDSRRTVTVAAVFFVIGVFGVTVPAAFGRFDILVKGFVLTLPLMLAPVIVLVAKRVSKSPVPDCWPSTGILRERMWKISVAAFLALFALSVFTLVSSPVRSHLYFALVAATCPLVYAQTMIGARIRSDRVIFLETVVVFLSITIGINTQYGFYYGYGDTIVHLNWISSIANDGRLDAAIMRDYYYYSLMHISMASNSIVSALPNHFSQYTVSSLLGVAYVLAVGSFSRRTFRDRTLAMQSTLLICVGTNLLFNVSYSVPRTSSFLMAFVAFCLVSGRRSAPSFLAAVLLMVVAILMHSVAMLQLLTMVLVVLTYQFLVRRKPRDLALHRFVIFAALTGFFYIGYTAYVASSPLWTYVAQTILESDTSQSIFVGQSDVSALAFLDAKIYELLILVACLPFVAKLLSSHTNRNASMKRWLVPAALMLVFFAPSPLSIFTRSTEFYLWRWALFAEPFVLILLAHSLSLPSRRGLLTRVCVMVFVFMIGLVSVSGDFNAPDNPIHFFSESPPHDRLYFSSEEIEILGLVSGTVPLAREIYADAYSSLLLGSMGYNSETIRVNEGVLQLAPESVVVIRGEAGSTSGLIFSDLSSAVSKAVRFSPENLSHIYSETNVIADGSDSKVLVTF